MKNKIIIKVVWLALLAMIGMLITGCDFDAQVSTNVEAENLFKSGYPGAALMLNGAFQALANVSDDITIHGSISTDDADELNGHSTNADEDMGRFLNYNPEPKLMYYGLHDARGQADRFLNTYLDQFNLSLNYTGGTIPVSKRKATMTAFAKLVRGWSTLYLGLIFDKVNFNQGPFVTPNEAINKAITDLIAVENLCAPVSAIADTAEVSFNGIRIRESANTLLAKAYLQIGDYASAILAAPKGYTKTTPGSFNATGGAGALGAVNVFFSITAANIITIDGNLIFTHVGNNTAQAKLWAVTSWFLQNDASDIRIKLDSTTSTNLKYTFSASNDRSTLTDYKLGYTVPRIPSKYYAATVSEKPLRMLSWQDNTLTWAEALVRNGSLGAGIAKADEVRVLLTRVTNDASAPLPILVSVNLSTDLATILNERRIEFYVEMADRFITLRRFGDLHEVSGVPHAFPVPSTE